MMKKFMTKPVLAVIAAATVAGGLTPVLANADTLSRLSGSKVVMNDETKQEVTRYHLKDLVENDPATLNLLLKTQADHLYVVVDELNLDVKMSTYIAEHETEWNTIYKEHYADIYLEVRYDQQQDGFIKVTSETKEDITYIKGTVAHDVTNIVVTTPRGDTIKVDPATDDTFAVSFAASTSSTAQYVTLKAYVDGKLVETKKVRVNPGTVVEQDAIIQTLGLYNAAKHEVKVTGMVRLNADKIYVTLGDVKKAVDLKKVWDGVGSFTVTFKDVTKAEKEALVEAYKDGKKIDSEKVALVGGWEEPQPPASPHFTITGTATISPKNKAVIVKGSIEGTFDGKYKLYIVGPDGKKQEAKLKQNGEFELNLSFKNRSFSSKFVHVELYKDGVLVTQTNINHGIPNNHYEIDDKQLNGKHKEKDKEKGHGKGHEKKGHDDHDDEDEENDN